MLPLLRFKMIDVSIIILYYLFTFSYCMWVMTIVFLRSACIKIYNIFVKDFSTENEVLQLMNVKRLRVVVDPLDRVRLHLYGILVS